MCLWLCLLRTSSLPPLDWPLPSQFGQYELKIEVQPKAHHRAHYETEGSRGAVKAASGGHPIVKVTYEYIFFYFKFGPLFNQTLQIIPKRKLCIFYLLLFLLLHLVLLQPAVFIRKRGCIQTNLHFFSYQSTVDTNINLLELSFGNIFATISKSNR